jgi:methylated-DNA-[protein]-cysteine S-methyltransferase
MSETRQQRPARRASMVVDGNRGRGGVMTVYTTIDSPLGELLLVGEPDDTALGGIAVTALSVPDQRRAARVQPGWRRDPTALAHVAEQVTAYLAGGRTTFDVTLRAAGTPFQQRVWRELDAIPYGGTTTYGKIAARLGVPRDEVPAVGAAIGANPILLLRPCHRVIGADGTLKGYAAGVERKEHLLRLEGALPAALY